MLNQKKLDTKLVDAVTPQVSAVIPPTGVTFRKNRLRKVGSVVYVELEFAGSLSAGGYRGLGTMPAGYYRTDSDFVTTGQIFLTSAAYIKVATDGSLSVYPQTNVNQVYLNFAFCIA